MNVQRMLPHRFPFLFVDRLLEMEPERRAVAIKNVSFDEPVFQGHFPGLPIFPGVLLLECMAQTSGLCFGESDNDRIGLLASVEKARFYHPVRPGDQLRIETVIVGMRHGFGKAEGKVFVGDQLAAAARFAFALRQRSEFEQLAD